MWKYYALLSAFFAALTAIFAKIGVRDINSDLATAIRTTVILLITWGIVIFGSHVGEIEIIPHHAWLFLILSGVATGLSWLFYFKAMQLGDASRVAPIDKLSVVITWRPILLANLSAWRQMPTMFPLWRRSRSASACPITSRSVRSSCGAYSPRREPLPSSITRSCAGV